MNSDEQTGAFAPDDTDTQGEPSFEIDAGNETHRSEVLHTMWRHWMLSTLALLRTRAPFVSPDHDITLTEIGHTLILGPSRMNLKATVDAHASSLTTQPDFLAMANLVFSIPALAAGISPMSTVPSTLTQDELSALWQVARVFLMEYFTAHNDLTLDNEVFEYLYDRLEAYIFHTGPFKTTWLLHLQNVLLEPDRVELADNLALRNLTPNERLWLIKQDLHERHTDLSRRDVLAVVEYTEMQEKWVSALTLPAPAFTAAQTVVLALRLLDSQPVGLMDYHWQPVDQPFFYLPRHVTYFNFGQSPMAKFGETYLLTASGADRLVALWSRVQRAMTDELLDIARTRLADSYLRTKEEDRLIDYWIALESLFLPEGRHQTQQAALAAWAMAHYLGTTVSERASIFTVLRESHELRNKIVHADTVNRAETVHLMEMKTGDYLRAALRKRIQE